MNYDSENQFVNEVEKCLNINGCKTWREVIPDECIDWDEPYRVDLIFYREDFGYVGVEAKNTNTLSSGGKIAKAMSQINTKYKTKTYFGGKKINKWTLLIPSKTGWVGTEENSRLQNQIVIFLRGFLKTSSDIDLLEYNAKSKWRNAGLTIGGYTKDVIKIGGESTWEGS